MTINGQPISLPAKEPIVLEHSYKFDLKNFNASRARQVGRRSRAGRIQKGCFQFTCFDGRKMVQTLR